MKREGEGGRRGARERAQRVWAKKREREGVRERERERERESHAHRAEVRRHHI